MIERGFWTRERLSAAVVAAVLEAGLLFMIFRARMTTQHVPQEVRQVLLDLPPPPPPPPPPVLKPPEIHPKLAKASGAASPANLRSVATPIVLPKPIVPPLVVHPTVAVAPLPSTGVDPSAGASDRPGEGSGSGGQGNGTGNGDAGNGDDDGGDSPPRLMRGKIKRSDYPQEAGELDRELSVDVWYLVEIDGRVGRCWIKRSSGRPLLDEAVCRMIQDRFRFDPSRDSRGRPVLSRTDGHFGWAPTSN